MSAMSLVLAKGIRRIIVGLSILVSILISIYGWQYWLHNQTRQAPTRQALEVSMERALDWLAANQAQVLAQHNPMLWWMLQRTAQHSESTDTRLKDLFGQYERRYLGNPRWYWQLLFDEHAYAPVAFEDLLDKQYYYWLILYALSCEDEIGALPLVQAQLAENFCSQGQYRFRPACVTHQLMGLRFMLTRACGKPAVIQHTITALQDRLVSQLAWDIRIVDVFIQRLVMLVESGAGERVRLNWLHRFMQAQLPDGGWGGFHAVLRLPSGYALGFSRLGIRLQRPQADFHATAQAIFLLHLLLSAEPRIAP